MYKRKSKLSTSLSRKSGSFLWQQRQRCPDWGNRNLLCDTQSSYTPTALPPPLNGTTYSHMNGLVRYAAKLSKNIKYLLLCKLLSLYDGDYYYFNIVTLYLLFIGNVNSFSCAILCCLRGVYISWQKDRIGTAILKLSGSYDDFFQLFVFLMEIYDFERSFFIVYFVNMRFSWSTVYLILVCGYLCWENITQ